MTEVLKSYDEVMASLCLLETLIDAEVSLTESSREGNPPRHPWYAQMGAYRENHGAYAVRDLCIQWAPKVEKLWNAMSLDWQDCVVYDYEFIPKVVSHIKWSATEAEFPPHEELVEIMRYFDPSMR